ncbi:hypothetical protein EBR57_09640 [bacterium]|nr:hypothetical protein [bacterium]
MNFEQATADTAAPEQLNPSFEFSGEKVEKIEKAFFKIRELTLVSNSKIAEFREKPYILPPGVEDLAEIMNLQILVLDEKYKLLFDLVSDAFSKLDELKSSTRT